MKRERVQLNTCDHWKGSSNNHRFPDVNVVIPAKHSDWPGYRITATLPKEFVNANSANLGRLEVEENGDLYMAAAKEADQTTVRQKIGRIEGRPEAMKTGAVSAINMKFFNDLAQAKPADGHWELRIDPDEHGRMSPIVGKHSSGQALGVVMPMHLDNSYKR